MPYIALQGPLHPEHLDALLSIGWYRMQQHVFTTYSLGQDDGTVIPVIWARVRLEKYVEGGRYRKLQRRCRTYALELSDACINEEIESLYTRYHNAIDFEAGPTVASCLLESGGHNFFPSRMWQLRDEGRLIAVGYFDEGIRSAAGILNFYDPEYRAASPGLWLYFQGLRHARDTGREFFYPGYIALGNTKFDYKLFAGTDCIELWDAGSNQWIPYARTILAGSQ